MSKKNKPSEFAVARGRAIFEARKNAKMSQGALAKKLGVSREAVSQYEHGEIEIIGHEVALLLCRELGLRPDQVKRGGAGLGDDVQRIDASPEARHIAYVWDDLPALLRSYLKTQIDAYFELRKRDATLSGRIYREIRSA